MDNIALGIGVAVQYVRQFAWFKDWMALPLLAVLGGFGCWLATGENVFTREGILHAFEWMKTAGFGTLLTSWGARGLSQLPGVNAAHPLVPVTGSRQ